MKLRTTSGDAVQEVLSYFNDGSGVPMAHVRVTTTSFQTRYLFMPVAALLIGR